MNKKTLQIKSEEHELYSVDQKQNEEQIIKAAALILENRIKNAADALTSPNMVKQFLQMQIVNEKAEKFCCLFLDNRNKVIAFDTLFTGTIDGASVYPREVVRAAINHNAAAVIFAHNHPSGESTPSNADKNITNRLKDALTLIDVRVLDHIVVGNECTSFAEQGLI